MSFSKAKMKRFNDIEDKCPAVGHYSPKYEEIGSSLLTPAKKENLSQNVSNSSSVSNAAIIKLNGNSFKNSLTPFTFSKVKEENLKLLTTVNEKEDKIAELDKLINEKVALFEEKNKELEQMSKEMNLITENFRDYEYQIDDKTTIIKKLKKVVKAKENALVKINLDQEEMSELLKLKEATIESFMKKERDLLKLIEEVEMSIGDLREELATYKKENEALQNELSDMLKRIIENEKDEKYLITEIRDREKKIEKLDDEIEIKNRVIVECEENLQLQKVEIEYKNDKIEKILESIKESAQKNKQNEEKRQKMMDQFCAWKEKLMFLLVKIKDADIKVQGFCEDLSQCQGDRTGIYEELANLLTEFYPKF